MSMSGVAGRCRVSRFPYVWVGCMKMATCRRMGRSMGVGIKTSMGNPSNVGLKVPVHVAQGSCGVFTELHLLHMYILYTQPSGLVISQHLCTLHTHQHQNIERGFGALSNISCHIEWGLLHRECHDCLFTAGTRHFTKATKPFRMAKNKLPCKIILLQNTIAYIMYTHIVHSTI